MPDIATIRRVAAVSTYYENIGDELIREGMMHQLRAAFGERLRFDHVSKSNALSLYAPVTSLTHAPTWRMPRLRRRVLQRAGRAIARPWPVPDRIARADVVAFAGTPLFYFTAGQTFFDRELWPRLIFEHRLANRETPRLVALGVGSILDRPIEQTLGEHPEAAEFLHRFVDRAALITTRDDDTAALLHAANPEAAHKVHRMICPSIWGRLNLGIEPPAKPLTTKRALIGYSEESASWDNGDERALRAGRRAACDEVIDHLKRSGYDVQLIAHNDLDLPVQRDVAAAHGIAAPIDVNARTLIEQCTAARLMVTWRVHGAMGALSMGLATLLFRTDSRYTMAEQLGAAIADDREDHPINPILDRIDAGYESDYERRLQSINQRRDAQLDQLVAMLREAM